MSLLQFKHASNGTRELLLGFNIPYLTNRQDKSLALTMPRFMGLRGSKLHAAIWAEACVCVSIFGYNQAAAGGVLTTESFNKQFPRMDTIDTTGAKKRNNATIQGTGPHF